MSDLDFDDPDDDEDEDDPESDDDDDEADDQEVLQLDLFESVGGDGRQEQLAKFVDLLETIRRGQEARSDGSRIRIRISGSGIWARVLCSGPQ